MTLEEYLLTGIAEEASEVTHAACKCLRFNSKEVWPGKNGTNIELLAREFNDLVAVFEMLVESGQEIPGLFDRNNIENKKKKVWDIKKMYEEAMNIPTE